VLAASIIHGLISHGVGHSGFVLFSAKHSQSWNFEGRFTLSWIGKLDELYFAVIKRGDTGPKDGIDCYSFNNNVLSS